MTSTDHNKALCEQVIAANAVTSRYPKVSDQVETLPLETGKLMPFGYNPSIIEHDGKILMSYRYHEGTLSTKLALAQIAETGEVWRNQQLDLPGKSQEDPHLFIHCGQLGISWVESRFPEELKAVVKWRMLPNGTILQPEIGKNDWTATEKNWVFLEAAQDLWCIYNDIFRYAFILQIGMTVTITEWPYGAPRGGCIVPWNHSLLRIFHSSLRNEWFGVQHRYYLGACLMDPEPPFTIRAISKKPFVYGSEIDDLKVKNRPAHWKANVVFCSGAIARDDHLLLSIGVNDSACVLAKVPYEKLNL